jgi:mercuric ion transport protein
MNKPRSWSWLLLFTTSGTLLCCALPITLVTLGLGASVRLWHLQLPG